jgi:hypothetical protein
MYFNMSVTALSQTEFAPPANSPMIPTLLFDFSHCVAALMRSEPMVEETQVAEVPEPSESRYWCIS